MEYSETVRSVFGARADNGPLFSVWTHFPQFDRDPAALATATVDFQKTFGLDFIKTSPNGMYTIEDCGVELDFSEVHRGGVAHVTTSPFQGPEDWCRLRPPSPETGAFARELTSLRMIREQAPNVPVFFTVFSPLTIASKLSQGRIREQISSDRYAREIHAALASIADAVAALSEAAVEAGADGVFYAHQDTGRHLLDYDHFDEFGITYDLEALEGARNARFNILHLHGDSIRFHDLITYPVDALNWHHWETKPTAAAGLVASGKCLFGGIDRRSLTRNDVAAVGRQVSQTLAATRNLGDVIVTPSCTIRAGFRESTLHQVRALVKGEAVPPPLHRAFVARELPA
ncbi:uroporphyrinogen decarboxylase family protein [Tropicimonas sp. IMCC6043]|uniref:uroporphyrinogen decarboxylase family protein n=1 Tax=Tropicimonas sp. IMCC6043 TaxID=2510645 RepID=UPI00101DCBD1|nr:uroporphyrinogen decarboxylase family protein [Tropicimonas sp. IMCC6043]RYH12254.1 uroporphyrinogen decarboxylase [Tropicimonas sp. IMCC6043]